MNKRTIESKNFIRHFRTGELVALTPEEVKAREAFLADSTAKEAHYSGLVNECMVCASAGFSGEE